MDLEIEGILQPLFIHSTGNYIGLIKSTDEGEPTLEARGSILHQGIKLSCSPAVKAPLSSAAQGLLASPQVRVHDSRLAGMLPQPPYGPGFAHPTRWTPLISWGKVYETSTRATHGRAVADTLEDSGIPVVTHLKRTWQGPREGREHQPTPAPTTFSSANKSNSSKGQFALIPTILGPPGVGSQPGYNGSWCHPAALPPEAWHYSSYLRQTLDGAEHITRKLGPGTSAGSGSAAPQAQPKRKQSEWEETRQTNTEESKSKKPAPEFKSTNNDGTKQPSSETRPQDGTTQAGNSARNQESGNGSTDTSRRTEEERATKGKKEKGTPKGKNEGKGSKGKGKGKGPPVSRRIAMLMLQRRRYTCTQQNQAARRRTPPDQAWQELRHLLTEYDLPQGRIDPPPDADGDAEWTEMIQLACEQALNSQSTQERRDKGFRLLLLLPRMLLTREWKDTPLSTDEFQLRCRHFWNGAWEKLLPPHTLQTSIETWTDEEVADAKKRLGDLPKLSQDAAKQAAAMATELAAVFLSQGDRGRAARLLVSDGLAPRVLHSFLHLWKYHPPASKPQKLDQLKAVVQHKWSNDREELQRPGIVATLKRSGAQGAGGPSQWRKSLLLGLFNSARAMDAWATLLNQVAIGGGPEDFRTVLGWCTLHGLYKDPLGAEIRPLGVGEFFRRNIASTLMHANQKSFRHHFLGQASRSAEQTRQPYQFAVSVKAGTDMLIHSVRLLLSLKTDYSVIKIDAVNAFNNVCRIAMLQQLRQHFPTLAGFFEEMYLGHPPTDKGPRILFNCGADGKVRVIWSREGTTQGDPAGPMLFAMALHPALQLIQEALGQEVYVLAYLDDIFLLVPTNAVAHALRTTQQVLMTNCNLPLKLKKCHVYHPPDHNLPANFLNDPLLKEVQTTTQGVEVVGAPVGTPDYELKGLRGRGLEKATKLVRKVRTLPTTQDAMVMLRGSCIAKLTYYLRVTPPSTAKQVGQEYDEVLRQEFEQVCTLTQNELTTPRAGQDPRSTAWAQAQLPISHGGYGFRS